MKKDVLRRLHATCIQFESQFCFPFELTYTYVNHIRYEYYYLLYCSPFVNDGYEGKKKCSM